MSATPTLTSNLGLILKSTYATGIGDAATRKHPFMTMLSKQGGFTGTDYRYTVRFGNPASVSGTFANAQDGATYSRGLMFAASRFAKFGVISINGEAIRACGDSKGSLVDVVTMETDAVADEHMDRLAYDLYRDGTGKRGQRASISSNTITLVTADDARNFKVGMILIADDTSTGLSPRSGTATVTAVSLAAGTVTVDNAAGISSFQDSDYLFAQGDPGTCVEGLEVCTPLIAPSPSESFRSKDRSVYAELLAGSRINDTSTLIEDNAGLAALSVAAAGGSCDSLYLNPTKFWQVSRRMGAKIEYDGGGGEAVFGFERIVLATPAGLLKVYSDPDCPTNRGRGCLSTSHNYRTLGDLVHFADEDGQRVTREPSADAYQWRTRSLGNYIQPNTRDHFVFAI